MTQVEQQKIAALVRCHSHPASQDQGFINGFKWLLEHDQDGPLTNSLKYRLHSLLWRYRRQLAVKSLPFLLPEEPPVKAHFLPLPASLLSGQEDLF